MTNTDYQQNAANLLDDADFAVAWPDDVRDTIEKAAATEGDFPPFAVRSTERALRVAQAIERKLSKDIEVGEASLTHAQRQKRARVTTA